MFARCSARASVRPPMPAPMMATSSPGLAARTSTTTARRLRRGEELAAARPAVHALRVVEDLDGADLAALVDGQAQLADALVLPFGARARHADVRDPVVDGGVVADLGARGGSAVAIEELADRLADHAVVDDRRSFLVVLEELAAGDGDEERSGRKGAKKRGEADQGSCSSGWR